MTLGSSQKYWLVFHNLKPLLHGHHYTTVEPLHTASLNITTTLTTGKVSECLWHYSHSVKQHMGMGIGITVVLLVSLLQTCSSRTQSLNVCGTKKLFSSQVSSKGKLDSSEYVTSFNVKMFWFFMETFLLKFYLVKFLLKLKLSKK